MSLLTLIQDAADLIGLPQPSAVISSTDQSVITLLAIANVEGKQLKNLGQWSTLTEEHTFSTVNGTASYALPDDFDSMMNQTSWNRTSNSPMRDAISAKSWQASKSGLLTPSGLNSGFRIKGNSTTQFFIDPTPTAAETIAFDYQSDEWCESSGGTGQTTWAADDDVGVLEEDIMLLGIEWRYRRAKGLSYTGMQSDYLAFANKRLGAYRGAEEIQTSDHNTARTFNPNIPETGFG